MFNLKNLVFLASIVMLSTKGEEAAPETVPQAEQVVEEIKAPVKSRNGNGYSHNDGYGRRGDGFDHNGGYGYNDDYAYAPSYSYHDDYQHGYGNGYRNDGYAPSYGYHDNYDYGYGYQPSYGYEHKKPQHPDVKKIDSKFAYKNDDAYNYYLQKAAARARAMEKVQEHKRDIYYEKKILFKAKNARFRGHRKNHQIAHKKSKGKNVKKNKAVKESKKILKIENKDNY